MADTETNLNSAVWGSNQIYTLATKFRSGLILLQYVSGEITLVALAPLTNIALAIRQDPDFGKKLKSVTIMGGNVEGIEIVTIYQIQQICSRRL